MTRCWARSSRTPKRWMPSLRLSTVRPSPPTHGILTSTTSDAALEPPKPSPIDLALRTCVASISCRRAGGSCGLTAHSAACLGTLLIRMLPRGRRRLGCADGACGHLPPLRATHAGQGVVLSRPLRGGGRSHRPPHPRGLSGALCPPAPLYCTALTLAIPGTGPHLLPDRRRDCRLPLPGAVPQPPHNHTSRLAPHTDNAPHAPCGVYNHHTAAELPAVLELS